MSEKLFDAIEFAARAHRGQFRKSSPVPYIVHPLKVSQSILCCGLSEELAIAALLHDVVEDTDVSLQEIEENFGSQIARWVSEVTEPDKRLPWEERKQHTLEAMNTISLEAICLLCADKLDNIQSMQEDYRTLGEQLWNQFSRPYSQQKWYYHSVLKRLSQRLPSEHSAWCLLEKLNHEILKLFGNSWV